MLVKAKRGALHLFHLSIHQFWVHPLEAHVVPSLRRANPGRMQRLLLNGTVWGANAGRVAVMELRLPVRRWIGRDWQVVYIGSGESAELLCYLLFDEPPQEEELRRVSLWQVPSVMRSYAGQHSDLVICELNQILHFDPGERVNLLFTSPVWVKQVLAGIDRPLSEILAGMNQNTRRRLRQMEKQGFSYEFTRSMQDFDLFYRRMYLPYIQSRHAGRGAVLREAGFVRGIFEQGGLVLVRLGGEPVCGMLCRMQGDLCEAWQMGVLDGSFELVKQGANVALWWFMLDWARRQGAKRFDFGDSRAQTANGTFHFKRGWGTYVVADPDLYSQLSFFSQSLPDSLRQRLNSHGFISEFGGSHYQVILLSPDEMMDDARQAVALREAATSGLDGILVVDDRGERKLINHLHSTEYLY
jgi:hypothetical protein